MPDNLELEAENKRLNQMIVDAAERIGEHFDAVRIFASINRGELTTNFSIGVGNFNAQRGHVEEWIHCQRVREANDQTRRDQEEEDGSNPS